MTCWNNHTVEVVSAIAITVYNLFVGSLSITAGWKDHNSQSFFREFHPDSLIAKDSCFRLESSFEHVGVVVLRSLNFPSSILGYISEEGRIKIISEENVGSAQVHWFLKGMCSKIEVPRDFTKSRRPFQNGDISFNEITQNHPDS